MQKQHPSQIFRRLPQPWCAICNARHFICGFRCRPLSAAFQKRKQRVLSLLQCFTVGIVFITGHVSVGFVTQLADMSAIPSELAANCTDTFK
eukprot:s193_g25.t1